MFGFPRVVAELQLSLLLQRQILYLLIDVKFGWEMTSAQKLVETLWLRQVRLTALSPAISNRLKTLSVYTHMSLKCVFRNACICIMHIRM